MRDYKWRDGNFEDEAPDEGFTKRLYGALSYLRKRIIYQKILIGVYVGVVVLYSCSLVFPIFPSPPFYLTVSIYLLLIYVAWQFTKAHYAKKELESLRDNDLSRYDDDGRFT